jgi:hypothetical protein
MKALSSALCAFKMRRKLHYAQLICGGRYFIYIEGGLLSDIQELVFSPIFTGGETAALLLKRSFRDILHEHIGSLSAHSKQLE